MVTCTLMITFQLFKDNLKIYAAFVSKVGYIHTTKPDIDVLGIHNQDYKLSFFFLCIKYDVHRYRDQN